MVSVYSSDSNISSELLLLPEHEMSLSVEVPPDMVFVGAGNNACFKFKVAGPPRRVCQWYKDGVLIQNSYRRKYERYFSYHALRIQNVNYADQGLYTCICRNDISVTFVKAALYVTPDLARQRAAIYMWPPHTRVSIIKKQLRHVRAAEGTAFSLRVTCDQPITEFRWYKEDRITSDNKSHVIQSTSSMSTLRILKANKSNTGVYKVIMVANNCIASSYAEVVVLPKLFFEKNKQLVEDNLQPDSVTIQPKPKVEQPAVQIKRALMSVVACPGARVHLDCSFDLEDPTYYFVQWYVGHHRVIRTDKYFTVLCCDNTYVLYIASVHPSMSGEVVCEVRRLLPDSRSVVVQRSWSVLTVVPRSILKEAFTKDSILTVASIRPSDSNYYNFREKNASVSLKKWFQDTNRSYRREPFTLNINYSRYEDGFIYLHTSIERTVVTNMVTVSVQRKGPSFSAKFEWKPLLILRSRFVVEMKSSDGTYQSLGSSSSPSVVMHGLQYCCLVMIKVTLIDPETSTRGTRMEKFELSIKRNHSRKHITIKPMELYSKENTEIGQIIGQGASGSVVFVQDINGKYFAAKKIKTLTQKKRLRAIREYKIMASTEHGALVQLHNAYKSRDLFIIVMEALWGGELFDRIGENDTTEADVVNYIKQILEALKYLHSKNIVHLDLKLENMVCLKPNSLKIKIVDFGFARELTSEPFRAFYGTRDYMAPEVLNGDVLTVACDMWSLGVITYSMLSGLLPFAGVTWKLRSTSITSGMYHFKDDAFREVSDEAKDFVSKLLVVDPRKRMTAVDALEHKWLREGRLSRTIVMKSRKKYRNFNRQSRWKVPLSDKPHAAPEREHEQQNSNENAIGNAIENAIEDVIVIENADEQQGACCLPLRLI